MTIQDTKAALDESAILHFGGRETIVFEKDGIRIGFLAMSYTDESRAEKEWIKEEIRRLKKEENANAVVFCYHGGREYSEARTQKQVDIAQLAVNAGADLVIMHHPHVVQGMSIINNRSVCYSLGNFCFGGNSEVIVLRKSASRIWTSASSFRNTSYSKPSREPKQ